MFKPVSYLKEVISELKKVTWPTRTQTINMTLVVIGVSAAVALYLTGVDYILNEIINFLIGM